MAPGQAGIDAAIAKATEPRVPSHIIRITLSSGREVAVQAPVDMTPIEVLALAAFVTGPSGLALELAKARRGPQLVRAGAGALPRT